MNENESNLRMSRKSNSSSEEIQELLHLLLVKIYLQLTLVALCVLNGETFLLKPLARLMQSDESVGELS